ncbi:hypothetical protein HHI36_011785, partial [Cryptolaemus montrouzieri]
GKKWRKYNDATADISEDDDTDNYDDNVDSLLQQNKAVAILSASGKTVLMCCAILAIMSASLLA